MEIPLSITSKIRAGVLYAGTIGAIIYTGSLFWYEPTGFGLLYLIGVYMMTLVLIRNS
uniref:Uncharacterized protein n=1 Tax=viral metagenome TaxID=1070528 RepID=A0A6M3LNE9_9ZZZZ